MTPMIHLYETQYGRVQVDEVQFALLMAEDWITQRPNTSDHLSHIMPVARSLRAKLEQRAKTENMALYHWLGASAD